MGNVNLSLAPGTLDNPTISGTVTGTDYAFTGVGDMTFYAGSLLRSGSTNGNTLLIAANDTTFITLTTGATDVCTANNITMSGTWLASGTVTVPALTLGGAIAGGDQAFTGVGDMTFTSGSILAAVDGAGTTLLLKAGGLSGTTFITLTSQSAGTDTMILGKTFFYDAGGEYIESDGTTLTIAGAISFTGASIVTADSATLEIGNGGAIVTGLTASDTLLVRAYDNDTGPGYQTFITLTAGNSPSCELDACILDTSVAKGTWTASGTWTIPAVTLGGTMTVTGQVFDAGAGNAQVNTTGAKVGILISATTDGAQGAQLDLRHYSASPAISDQIGFITFRGQTSTAAVVQYGMMYCQLTNVTNGSETGSFVWMLRNEGADSTAMTLSGAGALVTTAGLTVGGTVALAANNLTMTGTISATGARVTQSYHTNITSTNAVTVDSSIMSKVPESIHDYDRNALDIISEMRVVDYQHYEYLDPSNRQKLGIIAESVDEPLVLGEIENPRGGYYSGINTMGMIALQTKAIQELKHEIELLKGYNGEV